MKKPTVNKNAIIMGRSIHILLHKVTDKGILLGRDDLNVESQWFPRKGFKFDRFVGDCEEVTAYYKMHGWLFDRLTYEQKIVVQPLFWYDVVEA